MLLGGLWATGLSWNFVIWGGIHGGCLAAERGASRTGLTHRDSSLGSGTSVTFLIVMIAWVFFRAPSLPRAIDYLSDLAGLGQPGLRELE